jgi:hypothetical protein
MLASSPCLVYPIAVCGCFAGAGAVNLHRGVFADDRKKLNPTLTAKARLPLPLPPRLLGKSLPAMP